MQLQRLPSETPTFLTQIRSLDLPTPSVKITNAYILYIHRGREKIIHKDASARALNNRLASSEYPPEHKSEFLRAFIVCSLQFQAISFAINHNLISLVFISHAEMFVNEVIRKIESKIYID